MLPGKVLATNVGDNIALVTDASSTSADKYDLGHAHS